MKKFAAVLLSFMLMLTLVGVPAEAQEPTQRVDMSVTAGSHTVDGGKPLLGTGRLTDNVTSAVLYEYETDTILYSWNAGIAQDPSSFVKILTALLAVEKCDLNAQVTVTKAALDTVPYGAMAAGLKEGEILTVRDLLYCMLTGSANDAAAVLAEIAMGSQEAFVAEMNRKATAIGCNNSVFSNPHGVYDEVQSITARDAAVLLAAAMKNAAFAEIFCAKSYTIPATNMADSRRLITGNYMINTSFDASYYDSRVSGGRTGVADDGTRCLATAAQVGDLKLVCIVMGSKSKLNEDGVSVAVYGGYRETSKLLDAARGFASTKVLYAGQILRQISVENGGCDAVLGIEEGALAVLPETVTQGDLSYRYTDRLDRLEAPLEKGTYISDLQVWYGDVCVAHVPLYTMNDVMPKQPLSSEDNSQYDGLDLGKILLIMLAAMAVLAVLMGLMVLRSRKKRRAVAERKAFYRRRSR